MNDKEVDEEVLVASEQLTAIWISAYLDEIERVETFFTNKIEELVNHFILMQDRFRLKQEYYETAESEKKKEKMEMAKSVPFQTSKELINTLIDGNGARDSSGDGSFMDATS